MKIRRIMAVFIKQLKDTIKNKTVLIQFLMFPIMAFVLTKTIATGMEGLNENYFVIMFSVMYIGMVPTINMATIITEEKEKNTLRVLIMANVKPIEYLLGIGGYVFLMSGLGCLLFGLIGGFTGALLLKFIGVLLLGVLSSMLLGSAIGMLVKNQMSASSVVIPVAMVSAFLPMISMFNATCEKFARFLYTQQINYMVNDLTIKNMSADRFIIIFMNMILFFVIFFICYKKKNLAD